MVGVLLEQTKHLEAVANWAGTVLALALGELFGRFADQIGIVEGDGSQIIKRSRPSKGESIVSFYPDINFWIPYKRLQPAGHRFRLT